MAIITLAQFKAYRGITTTDAARDTMIQVLIDGAQAQAERWCDREFDNATYTQKYDGDCSEILVLRNTPITSITSITKTRPDGTSDTVESTTYAVDLRTGVVKFDPSSRGRFVRDDFGDLEGPDWGPSPSFPHGHQNLTAVYVGGYSTKPADLILAMYQYVDELYARSYSAGGSPTAFESETLGDYSYKLPNGSGVLTDAGQNLVTVTWAKFRSLFQPYRRVL